MTKRLPIGTLINIGTIIIGSLIGMGFQQTFPPNVKVIIFQALGLATLLIGIQMSLKMPEGYLLVIIFSLIIGGIMGEILQLDQQLQSLGAWLKTTLNIGDEKFTEGLITASLLYCVGSMVIVGAIEEGISGNRELLMVKSALDGVSSIAFASTYGIGVLFSIFPMLLIQGGITILANQVKHFFTPTIIAQLSSVGGLLILSIAIKLLNLGDINIENLLPSLVIVVLFTWIYDKWK